MANRYDTENMDIDEILEWSKRMGFTKSEKKPVKEKQWDTQSLNELLEPKKPEKKAEFNLDDILKETRSEPKEQPIKQEKTHEVEIPSKPTHKKEDFSSEKTRIVANEKANNIPISKKPVPQEIVDDVKRESLEKENELDKAIAKKSLDDQKTKVISTEKEKAVDVDSQKTKVLNPAQINKEAPIIVNKAKASRMESDKYRERFMNVPVQHIEKTADYEERFMNEKREPIERPGFVSWKNQGFATADLEPLPTIVPAEKVFSDEKTRVTHFKTRPADLSLNRRITPLEKESPEQDIIAGQIKLTGFEEKAVIDRVDEEIAEKNLIEQRKEKVKKFKLFKDLPDFPDDEDENDYSSENTANAFETDSNDLEAMQGWLEEEEENDEVISSYHHKNKSKSSIVHITDYNTPSEAPAILHSLHAKKRKAVFSAIFTAIIGTLLTVIEIAPSDIGFDSLSELNGIIFGCVNMVLIFIALCISMPSILSGIKNLFHGKPDTDTACAGVVAVSFIQCISGFFFTDKLDEGAHLYGALAVFALFLNCIGKMLIEKRAYENFKFITENKTINCIRSIDNETSAFEIGRGLLMGEPDVRYSVPIKFPEKFLELTYKTDPANNLSKKILPIVSIVSVIAGIVYGIIKKDAFGAISLFAVAFSVGAPCAALISTNLPLYRTCKALNKKGAMISGFEAVEECSKADAVVFDSKDIFAQGGCNILGIKTYYNMRIDEAILDAAAVVIEAGSPCAEVFDKVIEGRHELLPPVENLAYEDKLGLSAWIHGRRILVGNRELLIHHNVEVPDKASEEKYRHDGRQIMYLAVASKVSALFVVGYEAKADVGESLRELEKSGVTVLIKTSDANITEELVANFFGLNPQAIKIISAVAGRMYKDLKKTPLETAEARILHNGSIDSFLSSISSSISLFSGIKIPKIIMIIASIVSVLIATVIACVSDISHITVFSMIALAGFWDIAIIISSLLHKK
ncbi:MAG: hypothetical protein K5917_01920 [Clostridiales bacterium]|nr:hypothetical protein [Clostridiales bacterium]